MGRCRLTTSRDDPCLGCSQTPAAGGEGGSSVRVSHRVTTMRPLQLRLACVALVFATLTACSSGASPESTQAPIPAESTSTSVRSSESTTQTPAPLPLVTTSSAQPAQRPAQPAPVPTAPPTPPKVTSTKAPAATPTPVRRDANGFALGGPPAPTGPANYTHPTHSDCLKNLDQVRAWSTYQNAHRPPGSTNYLPSSGDVQYLSVVCGLSY